MGEKDWGKEWEKYYKNPGSISHRSLEDRSICEQSPADCYALTSGEIIIVIFARRGRRASLLSPQYIMRLMHLRNCFSQCLESDSDIRIRLSDLEAAKRSRAFIARDRYSAPRYHPWCGELSGKIEVTDHDSTLKGTAAAASWCC